MSECSVADCARLVECRGWCAAHYSRWYNHGDLRLDVPLLRYRPRGMTEAETFAWYMPDESPVEGCWDWPGQPNTSGYGTFKVAGVTVSAHVASYRIHYGSVGDLHVLHGRDRPICVQPAHLHLGTNNDNVAEALERDRYAKGEQHVKARLTEAGVLWARSVVGQISHQDIADTLGVSRPAIRDVLYRKTWRHVA